MPDFIQQRDAFNQTSRDYSDTRQQVFSAGEKIKLLERQLASLRRSSNPDNNANQAQIAGLERKIDALKEEQRSRQSTLDGLSADLNAIIKDYTALTDPREQLSQHFSNQTPFVLFPTRLETRFKTVTNENGGQQKQLWVRIYPDTCMVDAFDPQLSDEEVRTAARFWAEYYAAGEVSDPLNPDPVTLERQKAAWAFLVRAQGGGRAAWIAQADEAKPLPGSVFPIRTSDDQVILVIATEDDGILADQAQIFSFFKDLWRAGEDVEQIEAIMAGLPNAGEVVKKYLPVNFYEPTASGLDRNGIDIDIALVLLPDSVEATGKTTAWSQAAHVSIAPERFVLLGYIGQTLEVQQLGKLVPSPLQVGFDPNNTVDNNFKLTGSGDLDIPEEVKWIVDFDEAVNKGMGFRVNLTQTTQAGFDRLFVLGVRLSADASDEGGKQFLSELFDHHYYSSKGLCIVPQGTPTNNTEKDSAGGPDVDDPDLTFERYFKQEPAYKSSSDWQTKADGQWLAEWLGLDNAIFSKVLHAEELDQADAINMNLALWPGTLGYAMDAMMKPVFGDDTVDRTREFFSMMVTGRGPVPALRIANQPYGILPVTAFKRLRWMYPDRIVSHDSNSIFHFGTIATFRDTFLQKLYELLLKITEDWTTVLVPKVPHVSADNPTHTHQDLLDILGLHPTSVEYYRRYLQALELLYSTMVYGLPGEVVAAGFDKMEFGSAYMLLQELGYNVELNETGDFPLLSTLYGLDTNWEHKVVIDTVPLSEDDPVRSYTDDDRNYIKAIADAAATSIDALRKNTGLTETPSALLFHFIRFALEQGYFDTSVRLHEKADLLSAAEARVIRTEQPYLHMTWNDRVVESRYAMLYKTEPAIAANETVGDHIGVLIRDRAALRTVSPGHLQQLDALRYLEDASTARLERAFAEHLDCCSYRLDAWQQGLLKFQLAQMRNNGSLEADEESATEVRTGVFLGAFGWLENVRPEIDKVLTPFSVPEPLKEEFPKDYLSDDSNGGFIHAPSVNHAVSAAVLRNAFLVNGKTDGNSAMAVNLSSERIRLALSIIEGIQNGQSLGALLGYYFERLLHDQEDLKNKKIDTYIYALRKRFPLNANRILDTQVENDPSVDPDTVPISAIEARNVVHGKRLVDHVRKQTGSNKSYPFGFPVSKLPSADTVISNAITAAIDEIMNIEDAVADLGMAESVHQVCMGNYDRAAGVLESYSNGNYPQTPDIIRTPRSGPTLTHRVGVTLNFINAIPFDNAHPRRSAEPSLDQWLATMLPPLDKIQCHFKYTDRTDNTLKKEAVSILQLGLAPIDLICILNTTGDAALGELDERILHYVYQARTPQLDTEIELEYVTRPADPASFSLFEIMPLVRSLRAMVLPSPILKPTDILLTGEASTNTSLLMSLDRSRIDDMLAGLDDFLENTFRPQLLDVLNALPASPATSAEINTIVSQTDALINEMALKFDQLRRYGLPQTGIGIIYTRRHELTIMIRDLLDGLVSRLDDRSAEYALMEAAFDPMAPDATEQLQEMEALLIVQGYSDLDTISFATVQTTKTQFDIELNALRSLLDVGSVTSLSGWIASIAPHELSAADYDRDGIKLDDIRKRIVSLVLDDMVPRAKGAYDLAKVCLNKANTLLVDLDTLEAEPKVKQLELAARAVLGEDFRLIPKFELDPGQLFEIQNTWGSADLLKYLKSDHVPPFLDPEEDWLHGIARVREKMHHVENCIFLRDAFALDESDFDLHPIQLPFSDTDYHWLAMPFPADSNLQDGEHLLFTALTPSASPSPGYVCGLLVDEWTEVIPTETETTGLTFHYDRPNSEAPQTMLLVTPSRLTGNWEWQDLVDAMHYALDSAKLRGIEPYLIDQTAYARYLPPLVSPVTRHPITIGMYLTDLKLAAVAVDTN